ncbi:hypothetical protein E4U30_006373, partial [Claviceps sp. LM220 group G6]
MERTLPVRPSRTGTLQHGIIESFKQLPKSKQRRIADRIKIGPASTNETHEDLSTFRKY